MTDKELLQQALEALEDAETFTGAWPAGAKAIAALRERLAREDEPWEQFFPDIGKAFNAGVLEGVMRERAYWDKQKPSPSRRKGAHWTEDYPDSPVLDEFPVTQPAREEQEPVAVVGFSGLISVKGDPVTIPLGTPLYTASQPREELKPCRSPYCECERGKCTHPGFYDARQEPAQQPLSDEQIIQVLGSVRESITGNVFLAFARAIEAKLREKNA